jgi:hypothetical protein
MIKLTEQQKEILRAALGGKTLQRKWKYVEGAIFRDVDDLLGFFDYQAEWRIKPDPIEALAAFANLAYNESDGSNTDAEAWRDMIRALARKCPALLEVEL